MTDELPLPPQDLNAERIVLGCCMQNTKAVDGLEVTAGDFYRPTHGTIYAAILAEHSAGRPTDPVSIAAALGKGVNKVGGAVYLAELYGMGRYGTAPHFAAIVTDRARRRKVIEAAERATQMAYESVEDAETIVDRTAEAFTALRYATAADDDLESVLTLDEFCEQPLPARRWVLGHLLALGERLVITGTEGTGKTTWSRQMAVASAAGLQPFTMAPCEPRRVLALDLENPLEIMIDSWSKLRTAAAQRGRPVKDGRLMIDRRPGGLDLSNVADQRWLTRRVETVRPDLLVIGPVYKMYIGGDNSREETLARLVTAFLDKLRSSTGCALILEHHSPHKVSGSKHRDLRPIGSSLWMRWPEFGVGISYADVPEAEKRRICDVKPWRGPRAERAWPERIERGNGGWAWMEAPPDLGGKWAS